MGILELNISCLKLKTNLMCLRVHSIRSNIWCKKLKKSTSTMWFLVYRKCEFIIQHSARCVKLSLGIINICVVLEKSCLHLGSNQQKILKYYFLYLPNKLNPISLCIYLYIFIPISISIYSYVAIAIKTIRWAWSFLRQSLFLLWCYIIK